MRARPRALVALMALAALVLGLLTAAPAHAAGTATISGTITGPGGAPLVGVSTLHIQLQEDAEDWWLDAQDVTLGAGETDYEFSGLGFGLYRIVVEASGGDYAARTLSDAFWTDPPSPLTFDVALTAGAAVSGEVTSPDGSIPSVPVTVEAQRYDLQDAEDWVTEGAQQLAAGESAFEIRNLPADDDYRIRLVPDDPYVVSYSEGFTLEPGWHLSGVGLSLSLPATVSGTIVGDPKDPTSSFLRVYRMSRGTWRWLRDVELGRHPTVFEVTGLPSGTYRLGIDRCFTKNYYSAAFELASGESETGVAITTPKSCAQATTLKAAVTPGKRKAKFSVTVSAKGVLRSRIDGKVHIVRKGKTLATATVRQGKATLKIAHQKPGTKTYRIVYKGSVFAKPATKKIKVRIK
ncbi:MAG: carboxypeptidase-like regulatory domain-containing protein [Microbacterium sp.]|uniref:carboxypeptidase-like regulatory domain-containing protein n=1 Tax=Microbacterium sp. TaxID=51671 RepID=UPI0039E6418F